MMRPHPPSVSVFQFLDAREFLRQAYDQEKSRAREFSHRYIAMAMGARSSSFFKDVLNGRIRLSASRAHAFARLFRLGKREADYFESLVFYTQAETEDEKREFLRKLSTAAPAGSHAILNASQMEYFKKWHYAAVRELLAVQEFEGDYAEFGSLLNPPITAAETLEAFHLLQKLKLIRKTPQGGFEKIDAVVLSGSENDPAKIRPSILQNLALAEKALDQYPPKIRPFSYLTLSVSETSFLQIREKLRGIRKEILDIVGQDDQVDRLYQLNFQFFPLSGTVKRRKK